VLFSDFREGARTGFAVCGWLWSRLGVAGFGGLLKQSLFVEGLIIGPNGTRKML
jgi:hypothetical protein